MKQHFLQSTAWEAYQSLEHHQTFRIQGENYSALAILETTPVGNYLFCPYGPTLQPDKSGDLKPALDSALSGLKTFARKHQAFFLRLEPPYASLSSDYLKSLGLKKSHDLDPAHTWVIDLTQPQETILKEMRKSNVQYWQSSAKKGLTVRTSQNPEDITIFSSLLRGVADKDHFTPPRRISPQKSAQIRLRHSLFRRISRPNPCRFPGLRL